MEMEMLIATLQKMNTDMFELWTKVRNLERATKGDKRRRLLKWLSPLQPQRRHQDVRSTRLDNTGDWFLNHQRFIVWRDVCNEQQNNQRVLFCHGKPGAGKTVMSSIVVDHLADATKHPSGQVGIIGVACFYCDYRDQKDQNPTNLLGSLLAQFISELEEIPPEVTESFDTSERYKTALELKEAVTMLTTVLQKFRWAFICIDALDELETHARITVLQSLFQLVFQNSSNTSIFLTGRPTVKPNIKQQLGKVSQSSMNCICIDEIEIIASEEDIRRFLLHYIDEKDPDPSAMNEVLKKKILDTIIAESDGMFLLPALQIQAILDEPSLGDREDALNTLPSEIRAAYEQRINRK